MERMQVLQFLEDNENNLFPNSQYTYDQVKNELLETPETFEYVAKNIPFKSPMAMQILSVFPGIAGFDRFYLGDYIKGLIKCATSGGFFIWWLLDIFSAKNRCRVYNCQKLIQSITDPSVVKDMNKLENGIKTAVNAINAAKPEIQDLGRSLKGLGDTNDPQNYYRGRYYGDKK